MPKIFKNRLQVFILFSLISAGLGIFFRLYPVFNQSHRNERLLAQKTVYTSLKSSLLKNIEDEHPSLSENDKQVLVDKDFHKLLKENPEKINSLIFEGLVQILGFDPQRAVSFLFEGDSYFYYGLTENIQETGSIGTKLTRGYFFNPLVRAPRGGWQTFSLHPYLGFYLYKAIAFFDHTASLMVSIKWLVIILSLFCLVIFVAICYRMKFHAVPAFIGSIFFIISPFFTQRTTYGWYDTDVYNVLFPGGIFLLVFLGLLNLKNFKANVVYGVSAALLTYLYKMFWVGWIYVPLIILFSFCLILLLDWGMNRLSHWKNICVFAASYFFIAYFLATIVTYKDLSSVHIFSGWSTFNEFIGAKPQLWPNIFLTVAETQPLTIQKASFMLLGNDHLIYFAILGSSIYLLRMIKNRDIGLASSGIVVVLFVAILFIVSLRSLRFVILLTFPLLLSFTMFLENSYIFLERHFKNKVAQPERPSKLFIRVIQSSMFLLCLVPLRSTDKMCAGIHPVYNHVWEDVLRQIKAESPSDSIINSWWPPGHFITAVARRSVLIDGSSLDSEQSYWISRMLLTEDEPTALGILRMLNNGSQGVVHILNYHCKLSFADSIELLKEILVLDKQTAREVLVLRKLKTVHIERILNELYVKPRPVFFLVYNGLIDEYLMLSYLANWDFKAAEDLNDQLRQGNQKRNSGTGSSLAQRSLKNSIEYIVSMGSGLASCSPEYAEVSRDNHLVRFENNIFVNLDTRESFLFYPDGKKFARPRSLFFLEGDNLREFTSGDDASFPYSVFLFEKYGTYRCILLQRPFARTMLFKLYYLKGKGLSNFQPYIINEDKAAKTTVMVYKINWDKR